MGLFDDVVPGGNLSKPLMVALGALLVGKMMSRNDNTAPATVPPQSQAGTVSQQGDGGGFLGGLLQQGGGLLGGLATSGGLAGGLGGLLERLANSGHAETAGSWVGSGQNAPIQPDQLGSALGQTTVSDLARHSGMTEQELLAQLSTILPGVVDKLTPNGRVPNQTELLSMLGPR